MKTELAPTITDDDSEIMLDAATYAVLEADGVVTASLTRVGSFGAATVDYATADESATAGTDYTAATGSVSWADGESGPKTVTVAVLNNDVPEASRSFSLSLSNPTPSADVQLGEQTTSTLTIGDDDSIIAMDAATLTVAEDGASVTVSASRTGTALGAATVTIATADGTAIAPADYEATTSTLSWADGETGPKSIAVPIIDDQDIADDIAFSVSLSEATPSSRNHFGAQTSTDVTITDNDSIITLDVAEAAAIESDGSIVVSATRSGTFGAASVNYTTADGSAQAGTHYAAASGSFQWADGEAGTQSVTITLTNDTDVNADRSFSLTIDTPTPADDVQLGDITTTAVTITNDDSTVSLTAATQSAPEAEGQIVFIAERTGDFGAASVDYATTDGSATAPADYTAASGTLTWAEGETGQKMVTVSITDNDTVEADRDFSLTLSNPDPGARVALGAITSATATILDDDTIITLDAATASAVEDDGSVTLTATRSGARGTATVTVRTADGTAAAGSHYTAIDSTLSWADGEEGSKSIVVNIADDLVVNDDRGFSVAISNPMPAALVRIGAISESNVTVVNNDSSVAMVLATQTSTEPSASVLVWVAMVLATQTSTEADGSVIVQVTRVGGFGAASIDYSTADGSAQAGTHYTATAGTLSWADGQTGTMEITVPVLDDAQVNADRTFDVTLTNPTPANRVILDAQATTTVTVQSDDSVIAMDAPTTSAEEGDGSVTISATRSGASIGMASVLVMTSDGSAIAPDHYASYSERLSWADGESGSKSVTISLQDDSTVNDDRTFSVGLSDPAPAASVSIDAADSTTVTIVDDETVVALDAETYTVVEGGTVTVVASRSGSDSGAASVMYTTIDGTANSGTHYAATSGTLTWADGETGSKQFDITVTDDSTLNAARQFTVELSQPDPAARVLLGEPQTATVTIEDNETQVRFATEAYVASEGDGSTSLIVQRIGMGMGVVTVDYAVSGGSAVRGSDYSLADGTITWANGDTSDKAINVTLNDDTVAERTETVVISLSNVTSTGEETPLGAPASAALSIEDDDEAGFIFDGTSGSTTITEGGNAATASVVLSSRPTGNVTVSFDTPARVTVRTANPADNSRLVFTPSNWNVSQTVELLAVDDSAEQETVTQTITARTQSTDANYDDLSDSLQVTIIDNDGNQGGGGGGSGALGGGLLIVLGGLAALRRRRLTH